MTRTKKERKADRLLMAAMDWQNGNSRDDYLFFDDYDVSDVDDYDVSDDVCNSVWDASLSWADNTERCASAALSEVASMGFDIVDAETGK